MHWVNCLVLFLMIWSGLLIYWNDSDKAYLHPHAVYRSGLGNVTLVRFFPAWLGGEKGKQEQSKQRKRGSEEAGESRSTLKPGTPGLLLTLADVTKFPHQDLVTQFKCIEGWSQISQWAGVRLADFLEAYPPALINGRPPRYVYPGMCIPVCVYGDTQRDYYTGYDLLACGIRRRCWSLR